MRIKTQIAKAIASDTFHKNWRQVAKHTKEAGRILKIDTVLSGWGPISWGKDSMDRARYMLSEMDIQSIRHDGQRTLTIILN